MKEWNRLWNSKIIPLSRYRIHKQQGCLYIHSEWDSLLIFAVLPACEVLIIISNTISLWEAHWYIKPSEETYTCYFVKDYYERPYTCQEIFLIQHDCPCISQNRYSHLRTLFFPTTLTFPVFCKYFNTDRYIPFFPFSISFHSPFHPSLLFSHCHNSNSLLKESALQISLLC